MRTLRGLEQHVEKVMVSPDGRRIAALSNDWEIGVWDWPSGELRVIVPAPVGIFTDSAALAFNPDGSRLVCSAGAEARLWDLDARRPLAKWSLPPALTEAAAFRGRDQLLLVRQETRDREVPPTTTNRPEDHPRVCRLYDLTGANLAKPLAEIMEFDWYVWGIAMTPDGSQFAIEGLCKATGKLVRSVRVFDGPTGKPIQSLYTSKTAKDEWHCLNYDPRGTRLLAGVDQSFAVSVFEIPALRRVGVLPDGGGVENTGATRWIGATEPTADFPASLIVKQRDPAPMSLLRIALDSSPTAVGFSPDDKLIMWGSQDGSVTVCELSVVQQWLAGVGLGWE
jgi:WD40 repeat protein